MYIYIIFTYVYILQLSTTLYNSLQLSATLCVDARVLRFAASPGQRLASILIFFVPVRHPRVSIPIGVICSGNSSSQRFLMQLRIFCGMIGQAVSDHVCHGPPLYRHVADLTQTQIWPKPRFDPNADLNRTPFPATTSQNSGLSTILKIST